MTSLRPTSAGSQYVEIVRPSQPLAGIFGHVLDSSRARYLTLNASHFVVTAACVEVFAIEPCIR